MKKLAITIGTISAILIASSLYGAYKSKPLFPILPVVTQKPIEEMRGEELERGEISASTTVVQEPPKQAKVEGSEITADNIFKAVNAERKKVTAYYIGELKRNSELDKAAMLRAQDMLQNRYFSHNSPSGKYYVEFIAETKYDTSSDSSGSGENLALDNRTTEEVIKAWINSPLHYANILTTWYEDTGIAVVDGMPCYDKNLNATVSCKLIVQIFGAE